MVRTLQTISSRDSQGKTFTAELGQNVVVNGKVALHAGTKLIGKIESSPTDPRRTRPFTVNLTGVVTGTGPRRSEPRARLPSNSKVGPPPGAELLCPEADT
jgi:hypothetical protein